MEGFEKFKFKLSFPNSGTQKSSVEPTDLFKPASESTGATLPKPEVSLSKTVERKTESKENESEPPTEKEKLISDAYQALPERVEIPERLFFRIGDVSEIVGVKTYVIRYWETEFPILSPDKSSNGQRVYKRSDVEALLLIKHLLYQERYSIEGARKRIRELRKEGELQNYKNEHVLGKSDGVDQEALKKIQKLAHDLNQLARKPIRDIFRF